ncbi:peptide MFS transporter [Brevundimonas diminuta]|uniref:peptide MFS transporter n=1 Tax=Brevundimonas diminuta TaxID=293 RepID=UPI0020969390|nr:peptide MFS transporter [Brevundimonas diminuta]MCO8017944.1 peptide MFS transporter [Brevundimonas diminuta]MCO8021464.1 peptide MFS transporter [Brevundimonas diminuta]
MTHDVDMRLGAKSSATPPSSPATVAGSGRRLFGHPAGLWYLAFTEAWERFSYYGMQTLLVLYMVGQLLQPGHIENVAGFAGFRAALEAVYGPLSIQALASAVFGVYTGLVYLTPVLGGLIADRRLGRTKTIVLGGTLMTVGHFLMAFDVSFLGALLCLAIGTGCFKGNIAVQVGALYAPEDNARADAFQIFYLGISAGVIASPLVCGTLGEVFGWHYGFAAAGVGMAIGLAIYLAGRRHLPAESKIVLPKKKARQRLSTTDRRVLALLLALLPVLALALLGNQQIFNAYMLWAKASYDFTLFGRTMPTSWLITFDAAASVVMLALSVLFWRLWSRRFPEPVEITKLVIGAVVTMAAFMLLAAAAQSAAAGKVSLWWAVAFHLINSIGFAHLVPVALALYVRMAPQAIGATIVGIFYLHLFVANNLVGWVGTRMETMSADRFWLLHAFVVGFSAVILFALRGPIKRVLEESARQPSRDSSQNNA